MSHKKEKWYDAIASCQAMGMVLARPKDSTQNEAIRQKALEGNHGDSYWIGPYNNTVSNKWMFDTGYELTFFSWTTGRGICIDTYIYANIVTSLHIWVRSLKFPPHL